MTWQEAVSSCGPARPRQGSKGWTDAAEHAIAVAAAVPTFPRATPRARAVEAMNELGESQNRGPQTASISLGAFARGSMQATVASNLSAGERG
jgi:hypothetical protein